MDFELIRNLVQNGADVNIKNQEVMKLLCSYCLPIEICQFVGNQNGQTALMMLAYKGYLDMVKYLVENGADVSIEDQVISFHQVTDYLCFNESN